MKILECGNSGLLQLIEDEGVNIIRDENMNMNISDYDIVLMQEIVRGIATIFEYDDYVILYN